MDNKSFKIQIRIISFAMAVVLISCILLNILANLPEKKQINLPETDYTQEEFDSVINTKKAESYDSLLGTLLTLRSKYSDTLKLFTLGYSEKNRAIPLITMGNGAKKALVISAIHAREHLTTKYILRCIEDYCYAAEKSDGMFGDYNIRELLSQYTIYIVPCANPDGLEIVLGNQSLKPGVGLNLLKEYKANYNGVDLNRNFPLAWESINNGVTKPSGYFYKGEEPGCAKESKALLSLCSENEFDFLISLHIKGNCIFWGDTYNVNYNSVYKAFATDIAAVSGLYITEPTDKPKNYGGGFENWFRHTFKKPGVCVELADNENIINPCTNDNYKDFDKIVNYEKTKYILAAAMQSPNK